MYKISRGMYTEKSVLPKAVAAYKKQYERIPEKWRERFESDNWKIILVTKCQMKKDVKKKFFNESRQMFINTESVSDYQVISMVCKAFSFYIHNQYEIIEETNAFKRLKEQYETQIEEMAEISNSKDDYFAAMLTCYFSNSREFYEYNGLIEIYKYISDWMCQRVFVIPKERIPKDRMVRADKDATKDAFILFTQAIDELPQKVKFAMKNAGFSFILGNDSGTERSMKFRDVSIWKYNMSHICVKSYNHIQRTVFLKTGLLVFMQSIKSKIPKEAMRIYIEENKNMQKNFAPKESGVTQEEFYSIAFEQMVLHPQVLKKVAPQAYQVLNNIKIWD